MTVRSSPRPKQRVDTILLVDRFDARSGRRWIIGAVLAAGLLGALGSGLVFSRRAVARSAKLTASALRPARTVEASAAPARARDESCDLDRCAALPFSDPSAVDADELFAEATRQARNVDGAARLGGVLLQDVLSNGALNLTRSNAIVRLSYDLPSGGLQVDVTRSRMTVARFSRTYMDEVSPDVPCPLKRALDALATRGFSIGPSTTATLTVGSLAGRSSWSFRSADASAVVSGPSCVVVAASSLGR